MEWAEATGFRGRTRAETGMGRARRSWRLVSFNAEVRRLGDYAELRELLRMRSVRKWDWVRLVLRDFRAFEGGGQRRSGELEGGYMDADHDNSRSGLWCCCYGCRSWEQSHLGRGGAALAHPRYGDLNCVRNLNSPHYPLRDICELPYSS